VLSGRSAISRCSLQAMCQAGTTLGVIQSERRHIEYLSLEPEMDDGKRAQQRVCVAA